MSEYSELNRLADEAIAECEDAGQRWPTGDDWFSPAQYSAELDFVKAASPAEIKRLISECESAHKHWQNESNNVQAILSELIKLKAENERLEREANNDLIAYKAVIERQNELRAENAGLRTGYQAYERVNAELKAEVEKVDSDRKACWAEFKVQGRYIDQLKDENDALRKALVGILDLYDADEGCRSLPQYINGRAALGQGEQS